MRGVLCVAGSQYAGSCLRCLADCVALTLVGSSSSGPCASDIDLTEMNVEQKLALAGSATRASQAFSSHWPILQHAHGERAMQQS